jgi:3-oxoacyl-[acyl-carrier protein] reductase
VTAKFETNQEFEEMSNELVNKTALVTGGGNGIGREIAIELAAHGAHVISIDVDEVGNSQTASVIRGRGALCQAVRADVSIAAEVEEAFKAAGNVDILVNNAAFWTGDGFLHETKEEAWDRVLAVSLKGIFLCCRAALPRMMTGQRGAIINISSINALIGIHLAAYSAAKGGVVALTRVLAQQYGAYGIRANVICPGTIMTDSARKFYDEHPGVENDLRSMYPASSFGTPADVAKCVLFLASEQAKFINGSTIVIDGGATAVHRLASVGAPLAVES